MSETTAEATEVAAGAEVTDEAGAAAQPESDVQPGTQDDSDGQDNVA